MSWPTHFPALAEKHNGRRLAFLDSAASAQKPQAVIAKLSEVLSRHYANIHRGLYHNSAVTTQAYEDARLTVAHFLKANPAGVIFTRNSTEAINLVANSWGRQNLTAQSTITLTEAEHHANIVPWQLLQSQIGFTIKVIPAALLSTPSSLLPYLEGSSLLAITQMSNVTGLTPPLENIIPQAKALGLTVLVDGSQGAVHGPQNLPELGADFYTFTGHKLYGPTGIGVLWGKPEILDSLPPYQGGGDMIECVTLPTGTTFTTGPSRFEAGTPAIAEAIALAEAIRFVESLGWDAIHAHEATLSTHLTRTLAALPFVETFSAPNSPIVAFNVKGCHPADVATLLAEQNVAVRSGHHCAMPYLKALGQTATLRASLALYSTEEDVSQLCAALQKAHNLLTRHE